ncbi:hypothetical protein BBD42_19515 [Paenibacillus sp. BIHB 4019]|uniref:DUF1349 domain-containing protein n=1 Tax=Paenibacillus sp. BIHB 4019 TaxID=1870819 RepID=A0A1B2DL24_9BACL|nr:DUF1349 domain-containing protein [Paenibacillus sp. BIHB 4019]ANY68414.1 hypothetical protein BBD42_19515 [Paenibacillus sp. BIHB 4019]
MINVLNHETRETLAWMNEPSQWHFTEQGGVMIEAPPEADFFCDPSGKHFASSAPFLYAPVKRSFELTARLTVEMKQQYDSGCLMLYVDSDNWCKLCFEFNGRAASIVSVVTKDGWSDDCNSEEIQSDNPYLRINKVEDCVSFYYSSDGEDWRLIRYFGMRTPDEVKAGVVAQCPKGSGSRAEFSFVHLTEPNVESRF